MLGFFGAAGLPLEEVERAVVSLSGSLNPRERVWGSNLIHSPQEPAMEDAVVDLYRLHVQTR